MTDVDRRKYPDWLRRGPMRRYPTPIAVLEVPKNVSPEQLDMLKRQWEAKGYSIVMRPEKVT